MAIVDALAHLSLSPAALGRLFAPFPVAGAASYTDNFLEPRITPTPHLHQGVDIVANQGTPLVASATGVAHLTTAASGNDPDGGNSVSLVGSDGTRYYYAHLETFAAGLVDGAKVERGDILGTVGMTGDATGPHLHFEIHPNGGAAVDPAPYLDRWLAQAASTASALSGSPVSVELPPGVAPSVFGFGTQHARGGAPNATGAQRWRDASTFHAVTKSSSMPILALVLTIIGGIVVRRRQSRGLGRELADAGAGRVPLGFDPSDPLWAAREEAAGTEAELV